MLDHIFRGKHRGIYIAEIGLNHNGDPATAEKMVRAAADAGADAVKFQTFVPELMNSTYTGDLLEKGREEKPDDTALRFFRGLVLSGNDYRRLKDYAESLGLVFFSSAFDGPSVDLLESIDVGLYKVASSEVGNIRLLEKIADTGRPVILSTGISTEEEIGAAVDILGSSGTEVVLMHCVSQYPLDPENANLARIGALAERFGLPVGFSDHTGNPDTACLAAACGARIFEKHFTLDINFECPDKDVSLAPEEFMHMVRGVEKAIACMGTGELDYGEAEAGTARAARRSIFAARMIPAGALICDRDLVALRPGTGIPAGEIDTIIGTRSRCDIPKDYLIREEYLER